MYKTRDGEHCYRFEASSLDGTTHMVDYVSSLEAICMCSKAYRCFPHSKLRVWDNFNLIIDFVRD